MAIFTSAALIATGDFEYMVVAVLGFIYVTVDLGIIFVLYRFRENNLSNTGFLFAILNNIQNEENSRIYERRLHQIEIDFEENKKIILIHVIASLIIVIGCTILVLDVINV